MCLITFANPDKTKRIQTVHCSNLIVWNKFSVKLQTGKVFLLGPARKNICKGAQEVLVEDTPDPHQVGGEGLNVL